MTEMLYFPFWTRGPGFYSSGRCDISPHGCNFNMGAFGVLAGVDAGQSVKAGWHADLGTRPARVPLLFARRDDPGDVPEPLPACFPPSRGHYCHLVTGEGYMRERGLLRPVSVGEALCGLGEAGWDRSMGATGSRLGREGPQDRTEKRWEGDTEQWSAPGRSTSTVPVWWPGQTWDPLDLATLSCPFSQSTGSRNPATRRERDKAG